MSGDHADFSVGTETDARWLGSFPDFGHPRSPWAVAGAAEAAGVLGRRLGRLARPRRPRDPRGDARPAATYERIRDRNGGFLLDADRYAEGNTPTCAGELLASAATIATEAITTHRTHPPHPWPPR